MLGILVPDSLTDWVRYAYIEIGTKDSAHRPIASGLTIQKHYMESRTFELRRILGVFLRIAVSLAVVSYMISHTNPNLIGIDALVNDSLVGTSKSLTASANSIWLIVSPALLWGAYVVGMLSSLFAYLYLRCELLLLSSISCLQ